MSGEIEMVSGERCGNGETMRGQKSGVKMMHKKQANGM